MMEYDERSGKAAVQVPGRSWIQTMQAQGRAETPSGSRPLRPARAGPSSISSRSRPGTRTRSSSSPGSPSISGRCSPPSDPIPRWRVLRAVKGNEMYLFPSDIFGWDTAEPRWILGMMWLATKISPDRFADIDMKEEVYQFFGQMYSMDRSRRRHGHHAQGDPGREDRPLTTLPGESPIVTDGAALGRPHRARLPRRLFLSGPVSGPIRHPALRSAGQTSSPAAWC